jgi:hypothetical protein
MADLKISQLSTATTPLAGTEVVPIVQSGTTKKVSVNDLTAKTSATPFTWGGGGTAFAASQTVGTLGSDGSLAVFTPSASASFGSALAFGGTYDAGTLTSALAIYAAGIRSGGPYYGVLDIHTSAGATLSAKWRFDGVGGLQSLVANQAITFAGNGGVLWRTGAGTPEGAVTAPVGSLYTRTDGGAGTTLYIKESGAGNTGWVAK